MPFSQFRIWKIESPFWLYPQATLFITLRENFSNTSSILLLWELSPSYFLQSRPHEVSSWLTPSLYNNTGQLLSQENPIPLRHSAKEYFLLVVLELFLLLYFFSQHFFTMFFIYYIRIYNIVYYIIIYKNIYFVLIFELLIFDSLWYLSNKYWSSRRRNIIFITFNFRRVKKTWKKLRNIRRHV